MAVKHNQLTDELQEKASLFAVGALPEDERLEYVRHLEEDQCNVCKDEVREFQSAVNLIALAAPLQTPSPVVKERLMEQVRRATPPHRTPRWAIWASGISSLTAVAAFSTLFVVLKDNAELRRLANTLSNRVAQLESQITQQRVRLATITSPQVRVVNLAGQGPNANASGRIFWDRTRRRWLFYVSNLPPAPTDKTYQLWFIPAAGNPVSASVFNTSGTGAAEIEIPVPESIDQLKAAAVTTEPAGGLPQPSGAFALLGSVE